MKRKTVKRIFWFFILFLPLQYAAVGIVGVLKSEPWPALVLPAFKSVYEQQDTILLKNAQFYLIPAESGNPLPIESSALFKGINRSQRFGFIVLHFKLSAGALSSEAKQWLKKRINNLFPQTESRGLKVEWQREYYNVSNAEMELDSIITAHSTFILFNNE